MRPYVLEETEHYAVVYKPPLMHSAPLGAQGGDTLLDWYADRCPQVREPRGKKAVEGGLLHRLDFETQGLILFAKTQASLDYLRARQEAGDFVKDYSALTCRTAKPLEGFPPLPATSGGVGLEGHCVESFFRPWGPGRRAIRPMIPAVTGERKRARGGFYSTTILGVETQGPLRFFKLRISRGFRHQIRCHLAWIGEPILNDVLYGGRPTGPGEKLPIALRAEGFSFYDPASGEQKSCRLPPLIPGEDMFANFRGEIKRAGP